MPDISMCLESECNKKKECYRYNAVPNEFRQSCFLNKEKTGDKCESFWPIEESDSLQTPAWGETFKLNKK